MRFRALFISILIIIIHTSCSVKSDRSMCLSVLRIDLSTVIEKDKSAQSLLTITSGNLMDRELLLLSELSSPIVERMVPRSNVVVSVVSGINYSSLSENEVVLRGSSHVDSLWACNSEVACHGEFNYYCPEPRKQFCRARIRLTGMGDLRGKDSFRMVLNMGSCGLSLNGLDPVRGICSSEVVANEDGSYSVAIPRQSGNDLVLDFIDKNSGTVFWSESLEEEFESISYNWKEADLKDVSILVDLSKFLILIGFDNWDEEGYQYNVEI